jgi:hypothetical protein
LAVDPEDSVQAVVELPPHPGPRLLEVDGPWQAFDEEDKQLDLPCPGDWAKQPGWETFSGRLRFRASFSLTPAQLQQPLFLDLGQVGDIADVVLNGQRLGVRAWGPYVWEISPMGRVGENEIEVRVTNSMANRMEGLQRPSGLLGPVVIRLAAGAKR